MTRAEHTRLVAWRLRLQWLVLGHALRVAAWGLALGLPCVWITSNVVRNALSDVSPHDLGSFLVAAVLTLTMRALAAWIPARGAAAIHPMRALRAE
jgi:ABC-type lipoprotein release transport system permease subunit